MTKQIEKRIDVLKSFLYTDDEIVYQEVALYKVPTPQLLDDKNVELILSRPTWFSENTVTVNNCSSIFSCVVSLFFRLVDRISLGAPLSQYREPVGESLIDQRHTQVHHNLLQQPPNDGVHVEIFVSVLGDGYASRPHKLSYVVFAQLFEKGFCLVGVAGLFKYYILEYTLRTWIEGFNRHFSERNFEITGLGGEVLGQAA